MTKHVDPWAGFTLECPDGWEVRVTHGIVSVRKDPNGFISAFLWPIRCGLTPETATEQFVRWGRANNPTFTAWRVPSKGPVLLQTRAQKGTQTLEGRFTITLEKGSGLISGFQCLPGAIQNAAPILMGILASFQPIPAIPRRRFQDPTEGAFSAAIPPEWSVNGGIRRDNQYGVGFLNFQAQSDAAATLRVSVPWMLFQFSEPAMSFLSFPMPGMQSMAYMPAPVFAERWIAPGFAQQQAELRVEKVVDRPDLIPYIAREVAKSGTPPEWVEMSAATLDFTYAEQGRRFRERARVLVQKPRNAPMWLAQIDGLVRAPVDEFARWEPVLLGIFESVQVNPHWEQAELQRNQSMTLQMQQQAQARTRQISQTLSETSDIIASGYGERQAVHDRLSHDWSNAILERQDVVDPSGTVYNVPAGSDQYWKDAQGNFYGTGWLFNPDPTWQKLEPKN